MKNFIINLIIKNFLVGHEFIIKNWVEGYDDDYEPVYRNRNFIVTDFNKETGAIKTTLLNMNLSCFIKELKSNNICPKNKFKGMYTSMRYIFKNSKLIKVI